MKSRGRRNAASEAIRGTEGERERHRIESRQAGALAAPKRDGFARRVPHLKITAEPTRRAHPAPSGTDTGLLKTLGSLALFRGVPKTSLERLAKAMRPLEVPAGRIVFSQGDPAHEFFVLASGRVVVTIKDADPEGPPIAVLTGP